MNTTAGRKIIRHIRKQPGGYSPQRQLSRPVTAAGAPGSAARRLPEGVTADFTGHAALLLAPDGSSLGDAGFFAPDGTYHRYTAFTAQILGATMEQAHALMHADTVAACERIISNGSGAARRAGKTTALSVVSG